MTHRCLISNSLSDSRRAASFGIVLLVLMGVGLMFVQLGYPELKSVHEARVVVVADNMVKQGDWVVPVFNDEIRLEKPPLPYWGAAIARIIAGSMHEQVFRTPSALMGAAGVVIAAICAGLMFGRQVALLSALFTALTFRYVVEARTAQVDIYLTFCVALCLLLVCIIFFGAKRRDWVWPILGAAVAAGGLAKGPVIFIFAVPMLLSAWVLYPDRRPSWAWFGGFIGVFAVLSAIWPVLLIRQLGWEPVQDVWFSDIMRNVGAYQRRQRPPHFYLTRFFMLTFPWSILAGAAALLPIWKEVRQNRPLQRKTVFLVLTIAASIVFFSFMRKKKIDYIVPLVPFIGILIATAWDIICTNIRGGLQSSRINKILISAQAIVFIITGMSAFIYAAFDPFGRVAILVIAGAALCLGGATGVYCINTRRLTTALLSQCVGFAVFGYLFFGLFYPQENIRISPGRFCAEVKSLIDDAPVVYFAGKEETLVYHLGRTIHRADTVEELSAFLNERPDAFVLVRHRNLEEAQTVAGHIVAHHPRMRDMELPVPALRSGYDGDDEEDDEDLYGDTGYYYNIYVLKAGEWAEPPREFDTYEVESPQWFTVELMWVAFGLLAQTLFFMRFFVQWIASEKAKQSVMPVGFWWLSLGGGMMLLAYAVYRRDPVFIFGQSTGVFIYVRNLWLIYGQKDRTHGASQSGLLDNDSPDDTEAVSAKQEA